MAGMFDDLIPKAPGGDAAPGDGGMFDDLIPKKESGWSSYIPKAVADIPHEIYEAGATALHGMNEGLNPLAHKGEPLAGAWEQFKRVGSGLASIPEAPASPITGTARSLIGHPFSDVTGIPYEKAKEGVDLAMAGMRPSGFSPRGALPQTLPVPPTPGPLGVHLSEGQETGALPAIRTEQAALRGQLGAAAEDRAKHFSEQQQTEVDAAKNSVLRQFDPLGQVYGENAQEAGQLVSGALKDAAAQEGALSQADSGALTPSFRLPHPQDAADAVATALRDRHEAARAAGQAHETQIAADRENIRSSLHPRGQVLARSPQEAADIISGAVGNQAEVAQTARDAAYEQLRNLPGEFRPGAFNHVGDAIRNRLNAGTEPIRVNRQVTPLANEALRDLDQILGDLAVPRRAGPPAPREPITPALLDDTRKRLNSFMGDAITASRSTNNFSDVRAMRGIMHAFDEHVLHQLDRGTFAGDAAAVQEAMQNARALHTQFRRTFTPQGRGDTVGTAIQNIVGRYEGQAAPPTQIAQWLYGQGALPVKIARRMLDIFGHEGPEAAALRQGYLSHLIERPEGVTAWGPNQIADRIYGALRGPGRALSEIYLPAETRARLQAYANGLRNTVEEPLAATDVVGRAVHRIVGEGGQPATSAEVADTLFGRSSVGSSPLGVKIAQHVRDTHGDQSPAFQAIRQGVMARLTDTASGPRAFDHAATAERIRDFMDSGRPMAETVYTRQELAALSDYATALERHAAAQTLPKDEVSRAVARLSGRDGQPATPTEVADTLFGRSGGGDRGLSVRLAARLKGEFGETSPHWSGVKQGMFSRLVEPTEGKLDWGPQKISQRLHEFLNGNGRPLAEVMYSPQERDLLQKFADLQRAMIVPPGGANRSETSTFMAPMMRRIGTGLAALVGAAIGHKLAPGLYGGAELAGAAIAGKGSKIVSDAMNARKIARQMPIVADALQRYQRQMAAARRNGQPPSRRAVTVAGAGLSNALRPLGIQVKQLDAAQSTGPADAKEQQKKRDGGRANQPESRKQDKPHRPLSVLGGAAQPSAAGASFHPYAAGANPYQP